MRTRIISLLAVCFIVSAVGIAAADLGSNDWRVTFETHSFGPVDAVLHARRTESGWALSTRGVNAIAMELAENERGGFAGPLVSGKPGPQVTLAVEGQRLAGEIDDGLLRGHFHAVPFDGRLPLRDYPSILESMNRVVGEKVYNPDELDSDGWKAFRKRATKVAADAKDDFDFLYGIRKAWKNEPFSHFELKRSDVAAESKIEAFDAYRTGRESGRVAFDGNVAILTVDTMMGADTIEQIDAAYSEIVRREAKTLIIDVRENGGGAFAVLPLVQHVIREPLEAGTFIGSTWWASHDAPPTAGDVDAVNPWRGWSIIAFWRDVQTAGVLRIRFEPQEPVFDGDVFVLTSSRSASATELAVDALRASGRARIIGEKTAGTMLSGSYFDVADGFVVFLPVADYVARVSGRIDGRGIVPDIETPASDALERALALVRRTTNGSP